MNNKLLSFVIFIHFCLKNFVVAENSEIKWFLYKENLFYIDVDKNVNSYQAQQFCLDNDMVYTIQPSEQHILYDKLYNDKYESNPKLWILNENYIFRQSNKELPNECSELSEKDIRQEDCLSLKGLICKTIITGASVQYKNGTFFSVGIDGANNFCNPQTNQYDNDLEYCLIEFKKLLL